jgi:hypothetical protein
LRWRPIIWRHRSWNHNKNNRRPII